MKKRFLLKTTVALLATCAFGLAQAQNTPIKFQLDWRFEGPSALFLTPVAKGYFKDAKLDVTVDAGNGSGAAVTRVASGSYDIGFADLAALMEFHANNPEVPNKPVAIMMVYNNTPASVMALKNLASKRQPIWQARNWAHPFLTQVAVLSPSSKKPTTLAM
jgi:NitT/TauT family transport system substrate-binding protein